MHHDDSPMATTNVERHVAQPSLRSSRMVAIGGEFWNACARFGGSSAAVVALVG